MSDELKNNYSDKESFYTFLSKKVDLNIMKKIIVFLLIFPFGFLNMLFDYHFNISIFENIWTMVVFIPINVNHYELCYAIIFFPIFLGILLSLIFFFKNVNNSYFKSLLISFILTLFFLYRVSYLLPLENGTFPISDELRIVGIFMDFLYFGMRIFSILFSLKLLKEK